jgi:hypothetical protein
MSLETLNKLYATDDAMVWAEEWCKIAREIQAVENAKISINMGEDSNVLINAGWMVGWFANAMATAVAIDQEKGKT